MKATRRGRALTALTVTAGAIGITVATATPALAGCQWKVDWPTASVYATPAMGTSLKTKYQHEEVGPYCASSDYWNGTYWMRPVSCLCDPSDHIGWMRAAALRPA